MASSEQIEEQAQAWINATFSDPAGHGYWQNRYSEGNMEEAFAAGFAAGLTHARKAPEAWELEAAAIFMDHVDDDETGSVHRVAAFLRAVAAAWPTPDHPAQSTEHGDEKWLPKQRHPGSSRPTALLRRGGSAKPEKGSSRQ